MDGKSAVSVMRALQQAAAKTRKELEQMEKAGQIDTEDYKKKAEELKAMNTAINQNKHAYIDLKQIVDNLSGTTLRNLQTALKECRKQMQNLTADDPKMKVLISQYRAIDAQIGKITGQFKRQENAVNSVIKRLTASVSVYGGYNLLQNKLAGVATSNLDFSDTLADIQKTTGLTVADVNRLSNSLNKIDTRTSREELHQLAYEAGRLGLGSYGVEGVLGFTKAANQLSVALKENLGEDAIVTLTKMADVMGLIPKMGVEKSLLAIGSTINMLAQSSTANGRYLTDYASRLSGVAVQAHLTTPELFGLATAADATGQEVEVAATAMNKFVVQMQTHYKTVAAAAGVSEKALHDLLTAGRTADAVVMVLEALNQKGGLSLLAPIMKDLGSDGARLTASLATLASNVDLVKQSLDIARVSFEEGTSVTNEYNIKNETAAAILERMKNSWDKLFTNQTNVGVIYDMVRGIDEMSKRLQGSTLLMFELKAVVYLLIAALKALIELLPYLGLMFSVKGIYLFLSVLKTQFLPLLVNLPKQLMAISVSAKAALLSVKAYFTSATMSTMSLSRALVIARTAFRSFNTLLKSNAFYLVASILAAIIMRLVELRKKAVEVASPLEYLKKSFRDFGQESYKATREADELFAKLKASVEGSRERSALLGQINSKYKSYLTNMLTERSTLEEIARAQELVNTKLRQSIAYKIQNKALEESSNRNIPKQAEALERVRQNLLRAGGSMDNVYSDLSLIQDRTRYYRSEKNLGIAGAASEVYDDLVRTRGAVYNQEGRKGTNNFAELRKAVADYVKYYNFQMSEMYDIREKYKPIIGNYTPETEGPYTIIEEEKKKEGAGAGNREALRGVRDEYEAVMSAIKTYYAQQEQVINQSYLQQKLTTEQREQELTAIQNRYLQSRIEARKRLHGDPDNWASELQSMEMRDLARTQDSINAIANLRGKDLQLMRQQILKFGGEAEMDGIRSKLEEDLLKMQEIAIKHRTEIEKILLQYDYTGAVTRKFQNELETLRIFFVDYTDEVRNGYASAQQAAEAGMSDLLSLASSLYDIDINTDEGLDAFRRMLVESEHLGTQMLNMQADDYRTLYYKVLEYSDAFTEAEKKARERSEKIYAERYGRTSTSKGNKDVAAQDKSVLDLYKQAKEFNLSSDSMIQDQEILMYQHRLEAAKDYYEYLKSQKADQQTLDKQQLVINQATDELSTRIAEKVKQRLVMLRESLVPIEEFGTAFGEAVFGSLDDRQEAFSNMLESMVQSVGEATKQMILDWVKQQIEHSVIRQSMIDDEERYHRAEQGQDPDKKDNGVGDSLVSGVKNKIEDMAYKASEKKLTKFLAKKQNILKKGAKEEERIETESQNAQSLIVNTAQVGIQETLAQVGQQVVTQRQTQAASNVSTTAGETTANVAMGIASGAAQTIGSLGWWGIPLVAVITALLSGLLAMAMSKISSLFGGGGDNSVQTPTKLVTGMLTYDRGNVQMFDGIETGKSFPVMGDDGRVYRATHADELVTGLVSRPTLMPVNGEAALVGERGPEIVVGRETTAAMMMYRPDLLRELVQLDRNRNSYRMRAYDAGNLSSFQVPAGDDSQPSVSDAISRAVSEQMTPVLESLNRTMSALDARISRGIPVTINKYGKGGLVDEVIDGMTTVKRTGSSSKLRTLLSGKKGS